MKILDNLVTPLRACGAASTLGQYRQAANIFSLCLFVILPVLYTALGHLLA